MPLTRRHLLQTALTGPVSATAITASRPSQAADSQTNLNDPTDQTDPAALLRSGGLVLVLRHALAPGTFDPPGFQLGDCSTQRNLDATGRAQATQLGQWLAQRGLRPARVRSSPWCRCLETAQLAFGSAQPWAALGSPAADISPSRSAQQQALHHALASASGQSGRFEAWVTHQFVITDLVGGSTAPGDGLLLRWATSGGVKLLAVLPAPAMR